MLNSDVYNLESTEKVKTLDDDLEPNDFCLQYVKIIPNDALAPEEYSKLVLKAALIKPEMTDAKVLVMGDIKFNSLN